MALGVAATITSKTVIIDSMLINARTITIAIAILDLRICALAIAAWQHNPHNVDTAKPAEHVSVALWNTALEDFTTLQQLPSSEFQGWQLRSSRI